jgi:hypothetical protein
MRGLLLVLCVAACAPPPLPPPAPSGACPQEAKLPYPPIPQQRSVPIIIAWANTAARVANAAIAERDVCAGNYARLRQWADQVKTESKDR